VDDEARILEALRADARVVFALIFVSRSDGRARPDSDWDIAIYADEALDARGRFDLRRQLAATLEPAIAADITVLNDAPALLGHRALSGRLILDRDHARYVRYFVRTLGVAFDEAPTRRIHADARRRRLAESERG
jgi:uncharacterized protein